MIYDLGDYILEQRTEFSKVKVINKNESEELDCSRILEIYQYQTEHPEWYFNFKGDKIYGLSSNIQKHILEYCFIPKGIKYIAKGAFEYCKSLKGVIIPDGAINIDKYAFLGRLNLKSINIPDSVTSIGTKAFYNCISLTNVVIPDSVTYIDKDAFYNVPHITYHGTALGAPWGARSMN